MKIKIRNFRGVERADLNISGITLLAGLNWAGKSSVCIGVGAALSGEVMPVEGLLKREAGALVRLGADGGMIEISNEDATATIFYPNAERETKGSGSLEASAIAIGRRSVAIMDPKERAKELAVYLKAQPSSEDLALALEDTGLLAPAVIDKIVAVVREQGWDEAHGIAKVTGAKLKGAWEEVTQGERYGSTKAETWFPPDWSEDIAGASQQSLEEAKASAQTSLEKAIAESAVSESEVEGFREQAAELEPAKAKVIGSEQAIEDLEKRLRRAQEERAALPSGYRDTELLLDCPDGDMQHELVITRKAATTTYKLVKPRKKPSDAALKKQRDAIISADGKISKLNTELTDARFVLSEGRDIIARSKRAAERLSAAEGKTGDQDAVEKARNAVAEAERCLRAWTAKSAADRHHRSILGNQAIVAVLAPVGLRKSVLARAIDKFNQEHLAPLCEAAGWKAVTLEADFSIRYGGRPYMLLSNSEQYRLRVILQIAMAKIDGSALMVMDGAEILDWAGQNGLIKVLRMVDMPALIAMTLNKPETAPDLDAKKVGETYWIENGITLPLAEFLNKEAA